MQYRPRASAVLIVMIVLTTGCLGGSGLPKGETYSAVDDSLIVRIQSETELDYLEKDGPSIVGRYTIEEDDRVRIVLTVFGSENVVYADIVDDGLRISGGPMLYPAEHLAKAKDEHFCSVLEEDIRQLQERQAARGTGFHVTGTAERVAYPTRGSTRRLTGVESEWWAVIAFHEQCSQAVVAGPDYPAAVRSVEEAEEVFSYWERTAVERVESITREERENERRAEQEGRERLVQLLRKGGPVYGEAHTLGRTFPFALRFASFDERSGQFRGTMDYYPEDDRALLTIAGRLEGAQLTFEHTGVERAGKSEAEFVYTLTSSPTALDGEYRRKGATNRGGRVAFALDQATQQARAAEAARIERHLALVTESRTPSRAITTVKLDRRNESARLTDVSIVLLDWRSEQDKESVYYFDRISEVDSFETSGTCNVSFKGPARSGFGDYMRVLDIRDKGRCRAFLIELQTTWEQWKARYPSLVAKSARRW